ncbi:MAG: hypothetical protein ACN6O1_05715 [Comamonas sp.]|uniref:hypothetical protein n=1 Tax=Comamonas sp. TaxID=34028 RepID=UPI003D12C9CB
MNREYQLTLEKEPSGLWSAAIYTNDDGKSVDAEGAYLLCGRDGIASKQEALDYVQEQLASNLVDVE